MIARAAVAVLVTAATAALSACGGSSTVTIHGQLEPGGGALASTGGGGLAQTYAECNMDSPSPSSQVTVTDPGGKAIGTATLGT